MTTDTDLRLCHLFGLSDGGWLRLQADYDVATATVRIGDVLDRVRPVVGLAQNEDITINIGSGCFLNHGIPC